MKTSFGTLIVTTPARVESLIPLCEQGDDPMTEQTVIHNTFVTERPAPVE